MEVSGRNLQRGREGAVGQSFPNFPAMMTRDDFRRVRGRESANGEVGEFRPVNINAHKDQMCNVGVDGEGVVAVVGFKGVCLVHE